MEFEYGKLCGKIKEVFVTQECFADELGIGRECLEKRLDNDSEFSRLEIFKACKLLNIPMEDIKEYFFTLKVQKDELKED